MENENNELQEFIADTLRQIDAGAAGHDVSNKVEFEISVAKKTLKGGKVGVEVLGQGIKGEATVDKQQASKIKFHIRMRRKEEQERLQNQIAQASQNRQQNRELLAESFGL